MEAADSGARQSGHSSANSSVTTFSNNKLGNGPEQHPSPYHPQREPLERPPPQDQSAMAAATVLPPASQYHSQPPYPSTYPQPGPAPSLANMISSAEPRRPTDDNEAPARQSLPSISEVISGTKPAQFHPPPHHAMQPGSSLPSPFAPMSRPFPDAEKHSSPQPLHPSSSFPPRQDPLPAFSDSPRSAPFSGRPSLPPVPDHRTSPPTNAEGPPHHHAHESHRSLEPHGINGAYPHHPQHQPARMPLHPMQLPPGEMPLPIHIASPRHAPGPYDPRPPHGHPGEPEYPPGQRYEAVNNHFENWSFQDGLGRIASASRTTFNFAEAWARVAQEQHGPPILQRLPTEGEVGDMLSNVELLKRSLEEIRDMILITIQNERAAEGAKKRPWEDDEEMAMYSNGVKSQYGATEVKKRRGRAAPPGRCHSCNRIDTPEWRRGPDGARTLCNACGLHYAKLERKRQLEARPTRPKPDERP